MQVKTLLRQRFRDESFEQVEKNCKLQINFVGIRKYFKKTLA